MGEADGIGGNWKVDPGPLEADVAVADWTFCSRAPNVSEDLGRDVGWVCSPVEFVTAVELLDLVC